MRYKLLSSVLISACLLTLGIINSNFIVHADTINSEQVATTHNESNNDSTYTVPAQFKALDKYVIVKDNQYVLEIPQNENDNSTVVKEAERQLNIANKIVRQQNLLIDPQTKFADTVSPDNGLPFISLARRSANENRTYPWGIRSIFRSNAAVRTRVNIYNNVYIGAMAVGDVSGTASMSGFPWAGLVGVVGSSVVEDRCGTWANRLYSYNKSHKRNKIYQDINWAAQDSEGVWHD